VLGVSDKVSAAIDAAIAQCKARSSRPPDRLSGCGALHRQARDGWGIGEICGRHWTVSVKPTLAEAEYDLRAWKLSMKYEYGYALPQCRRVITVGPDGNEYDYIQY
jgi:hypothetical protein